MKSGVRKGFLSDESVLLHCPDQQQIPLNKMHLAARSGTKISRPQKAMYMYQNLNLPQSQTEELIRDFNLRSQKAKPLVIPARQYSTLSLDKPNALVTQVATQPGGGVARDLAAALTNAVTQTIPLNDAVTQTDARPNSSTSVSQLTSEPGTPDDEPELESPNPNEPSPASDDSGAETDEDEGLGGTGLLIPTTMFTPGGTSTDGYKEYTPHHTRDGAIFNVRSPPDSQFRRRRDSPGNASDK